MTTPILFDERYSATEQLPRRLIAEFVTKTGRYGQIVRLIVNGLPVGDPLTDRGWSETGYRWHDALHLAHAVCLGWSPVFRGLAGRRRRSDPPTDHIEDGGRAVVADEAIAWATFCYARTHHWSPGRALFDRIQEMTFGLEVAACTRRQWEHAITTGLSCMLGLWRSRGGTLHGAVDAATPDVPAATSQGGQLASARPYAPRTAKQPCGNPFTGSMDTCPTWTTKP